MGWNADYLKSLPKNMPVINKKLFLEKNGLDNILSNIISYETGKVIEKGSYIIGLQDVLEEINILHKKVESMPFFGNFAINMLNKKIPEDSLKKFVEDSEMELHIKRYTIPGIYESVKNLEFSSDNFSFDSYMAAIKNVALILKKLADEKNSLKAKVVEISTPYINRIVDKINNRFGK